MRTKINDHLILLEILVEENQFGSKPNEYLEMKSFFFKKSPFSYFTVTTLLKDGEIITTSNTQIVSNVLQPSTTQRDEIVPTSRVALVKEVAPSIILATPSIVEASTLDNNENALKLAPSSDKNSENTNGASIVTPTPSLLEPTTYYITYTYCKYKSICFVFSLTVLKYLLTILISNRIRHERLHSIKIDLLFCSHYVIHWGLIDFEKSF